MLQISAGREHLIQNLWLVLSNFFSRRNNTTIVCTTTPFPQFFLRQEEKLLLIGFSLHVSRP